MIRIGGGRVGLMVAKAWSSTIRLGQRGAGEIERRRRLFSTAGALWWRSGAEQTVVVVGVDGGTDGIPGYGWLVLLLVGGSRSRSRSRRHGQSRFVGLQGTGTLISY